VGYPCFFSRNTNIKTYIMRIANMARTQITRNNIKDRNLTGASLADDLKFYDETKNYNSGDRVFWQGIWYEASNSVTGTDEGDLSNSPDQSPTYWSVVKSLIYNSYPSASQSFTNASRITIAFDTERKNEPSNIITTASNGELTFNSNGNFILTVSVTYDNTSNNRDTIYSYVQYDTGSGWTDITSAKLYNYSRNSADGEGTSSITFPLSASSGDKLRVQCIARNSDTINTVPDGMNLTIVATSGGAGPKGEKGDKGDDGVQGDIVWRGAYNSSTTYNENDAVENNGSSYVCLNDGTSGDAPPSSNWDLIAQKGTNGSGSTVNVSDSSTSLPNTPHNTLNFTGDITATDSGSGVAEISYTTPKNTYMVPIWAEENAALAANTYEWAFGNGANTPNGHGVSIYVPSGYSCSVVALSLNIRQGTATVELELNGALQGSNCDVSVNSGTANTNDSFTPVSVSNNDIINFHTVTQNNTGGPNVITAWLKYTEN
jgi:hypothetical protein